MSGSERGVKLFYKAEYCGTPQSKETRKREYKVCLNERATCIDHFQDNMNRPARRLLRRRHHDPRGIVSADRRAILPRQLLVVLYKHDCCLSDTKAVLAGKHKVEFASVLAHPLGGEVAMLSGANIPFLRVEDR